jgi:hypothetical protein
MESLAVAIKILPGKTQDVKNMINILKNEKWSEYLESQKRQGITLEKDFLQTSPEGDLFYKLLGSGRPQKSMRVMMASKEPFDAWLKQQYENFSGIKMDQPHLRMRSKVLHYFCPSTLTQPKNWLNILYFQKADNQLLYTRFFNASFATIFIYTLIFYVK